MTMRHAKPAERSRLKLLAALAGGAATGGCLADYGENALQEQQPIGSGQKPAAGPARRQGASPPAPAPRQDGEGGGGGGGGGGSH